VGRHRIGESAVGAALGAVVDDATVVAPRLVGPGTVAPRTGLSLRLWICLGVVLAVFAGGVLWVTAGPRHASRAAPGSARVPAPGGATGGPAAPAPSAPGGPTASSAGTGPQASGSRVGTPTAAGGRAAGTGPGRAGPATSAPAAPVVGASASGPAAPPPGAVVVRATSVQTWQGGYAANYSVDNGTSARIDTWHVVLTFSVPVSGQAWNAAPQTFQSTTTVTLGAVSYNATVAPGQTQSFGLQATNPAGSTPVPVGCTVNGAPCGG
jgi:cellulose binding protein with CBM2 domain